MRRHRHHDPTLKELTGFGLSVVTDSIFTGRTLEEIGTEASFSDPALLGHHGYAQVVSTTGQGPVLLVLPSNGTACEAWRMLREDPSALRALVCLSTIEHAAEPPISALCANTLTCALLPSITYLFTFARSPQASVDLRF